MFRTVMRPSYLSPKLTDANRIEIRRLHATHPRDWSQAKLARKFGVNRSTIARALRKRVRINAEQELASLRAAIEDSGAISTRELLRVKTQLWNRQLLAETDLGRQQQLVNLIKSAAPMLEMPEPRRGRAKTISEIEAEREASERELREAFQGCGSTGAHTGNSE